MTERKTQVLPIVDQLPPQARELFEKISENGLLQALEEATGFSFEGREIPKAKFIPYLGRGQWNVTFPTNMPEQSLTLEATMRTANAGTHMGTFRVNLSVSSTGLFIEGENITYHGTNDYQVNKERIDAALAAAFTKPSYEGNRHYIR